MSYIYNVALKNIWSKRLTNLLSLVFLFSFVQTSAYAEVNAVDFKELKRSQIITIVEALTPHFHSVRNRIQQGSDTYLLPEEVEKDINAIDVLSQYPFYESLMTIWARLKFEMFHVQLGDQDADIKEGAIEAIKFMASSKDKDLVGDLDTAIKVLKNARYKLSSEHSLSQKNLSRLENLRTALGMKTDAEPLPSIDELLGRSRMDKGSAERHLKEFSEILNKRIIGQPEVIEALEALEWERLFTSSPENTPDVIYFMGSPGTGKDTAAEAFTDALHGEEGAFHEHMFRLPLMRERPDLWQVLGSATGYVGSENLPPFLEFLVNHSGGRYKLDKAEEGLKIIENPDWKGSNLPNFAPPESAVVFINEFHSWSKEIKDVFIKQALEKGLFSVNNPNGGLAQIQVPVRFVIASNEGISLITSRESNGQRYGKSLNFDEMLGKWQRVHLDKKALKADIMATNGPARGGGSAGREGISEELLNRIPDRFLLLLRPLSPESLKAIAKIELDRLSRSYKKASPLNPGIEIVWPDSIYEFVQSYDYNAEDNGRPIATKIRSLIKEPLIQFFKSGTIDSDFPLKLTISVVSNDNGTKSLEIKVVSDEGQDLGTFHQLIKATEKDLIAEPIDDALIDRLARLPEVIKSRVFGVDEIAERVSDRVLSLANRTSQKSDSPRSASAIVLMGPTSTGKTELSKAITEALTGDDKNALVIDFSQVQTLHEFKTRILGVRDSFGNPIPSDFMKHYDRLDGDVVVVMDELSNVRDPDLLKSLYDFFREPILSTFSDGKDRDMSRVKVIVTGNSGIELYKNVPRDVPMEQQMMAWDEISKRLTKDREMQRVILEKNFPEPLLARWGLNNIFFVSPHNYKSLKQLTQLKLSQMIKKIKASDGHRGWDLGFASVEDYEAFVHSIIENAFNLRDQGASIDAYIKDDLLAPLEVQLLKSKVPSGSRILIKKSDDGFMLYSDVSEYSGLFKLPKVKDQNENSFSRVSDHSRIVTAYHEVGHALAEKLLFEGLTEPKLISIVPGVAKIGLEWVAYAGIAESRIYMDGKITREWVIRRIAQLAAGETAERLITQSEVHSAGKENDMKRATRLAELAVLKFGLSEAWGTESVPAGMELNDFVSRFSEEKKRKFEAEVSKLILEGRALARELLVKNFDTVVVPLSKELAKKGTLKQEEMAPFFEKAQMVDVSEIKNPNWFFSTQTWIRSKVSGLTGRSLKRDGSIRSQDLLPDSVANIEEIVEDRKRKLYSQVQPPGNVPLFDESEFKSLKLDCNDLLK